MSFDILSLMNQFNRIRDQKTSEIIECSTNTESDTLNIYVHGYSAIRNDQELQHLIETIANVPDATNWFYVWDADHFMNHLMSQFKINQVMGSNLNQMIFTTLVTQFSKIAQHFMSMQTRSENEGKSNFLPLVQSHLNQKSRKFKKINFIGHSLGARLLYFAIKNNLSTIKSLPIENLVLLGGAINHQSDWASILSAIHGKLKNCYSKHDQILKFKPDLEACVGRYSIEIDNLRVENYIFEIGHTDYWDNLNYILEQIRLKEIKNQVHSTLIISNETDFGVKDELIVEAFEQNEQSGEASKNENIPILQSEIKPYLFAISDDDLFPILYQAKEHEVSKITEIISSKSSSSISVKERAIHKITDELQRMGGDSVMNLKRGHGVSYREIVLDILSVFKIKPENHSEYPIDELESILLTQMLKAYYDGLDDQEKKEFDQNNFDQTYPTFDLLTPQVKAYILKQAIFKVGITILISAIIRRMAVALIPGIGTLSSITFLATLLTGPAYLVTMPCVICVAEIRNRLTMKTKSLTYSPN